MINVGYSNRTPFHSPREVGEEELGCMVERLASEVASAETAIFNIHVPPSGTRLDLAPEIDEEFRIKTRLGHPNMVHVGSKAVHAAIGLPPISGPALKLEFGAV